jgi:hypothetical protein
MRLRLAVILLVAGLIVGLASGPGAAAAQARVVQPHLPALGKEPAVSKLRGFLRELRHRRHASDRAWRRLLAHKRHFTGAAKNTLEARDHRRKQFLKAYLKGRHRHERRTAKDSKDYYAYLRSLESHLVRQIVARISDEMDRLIYS